MEERKTYYPKLIIPKSSPLKKYLYFPWAIGKRKGSSHPRLQKPPDLEFSESSCCHLVAVWIFATQIWES